MEIFLGDKYYNYSNVTKIINRYYINKPLGGLWVSKKNNNNSEYICPWHEFCIETDFNVYTPIYMTEIKIDDKAKIFKINSYEDYDLLFNDFPVTTNDFNLNGDFFKRKQLDFEAIALHFDVIELTEAGIIDTRKNFSRCELYSWDIASSVILNKNVIIPVRYKILDSVRS